MITLNEMCLFWFWKYRRDPAPLLKHYLKCAGCRDVPSESLVGIVTAVQANSPEGDLETRCTWLWQTALQYRAGRIAALNKKPA